MEKMNEKMRMIGASITDQAKAERSRIIEEAVRLRERELAACKEELIESMFRREQQQARAVRQKTVTDKAKAELRAHRELLARREELSLSVFAAATARLHEYAQTPEYRQKLLDGLRALAGTYDPAACTVYLREADTSLAAEIAGVLPGAKVAADKSVKIGGFKLLCEEAGVLVDETLDSRLEERKPWFRMNCGLKIG